MKKYFIFLFIIFSTALALPVYAEVLSNSGFIPGQIWYSEDKLIEGDTVNIHTAVWNGESKSLSVKVEFYDKNVVLGNREVVVNSLELKDVYISWKVTSGDHVISAKIVSSVATISNKKEKVVLNRNVTSNDKQFVSVVVKNNSGETVTGGDMLQNQIGKASSEIVSIVPEQVSAPVSSMLGAVDTFRVDTLSKVEVAKDDTKKKIDSFDKDTKVTVSQGKVEITNASEKPIAYVKLFLFSALAFILGNKIVFYGIIAVVVFYILRFVYRKIRNK